MTMIERYLNKTIKIHKHDVKKKDEEEGGNFLPCTIATRGLCKKKHFILRINYPPRGRLKIKSESHKNEFCK